MGFLTAVVAIEDAAGQRIDQARADGSRAPIVLVLDATLAATSEQSGGLTKVTIGLASAAGVPSDADPVDVVMPGEGVDPGISTEFARADHTHELSGAAVDTIRRVPLSPVKTADYTAVIGELVRCDPSGGGFEVTLPTAVGNDGMGITIKNVTDSTNAIALNTTSGQTIDGAASGVVTIAEARGTLTVISDDANWMLFPPV